MTRSGYAAEAFADSQITAAEAATLSPWAYLEIVRTRWWVTALCVLGTMSVGVLQVASTPDLFTATTLVQKHLERSPLEVFANDARGGLAPDITASEVELLRSRSVLGPTVEAQALQLRLPGSDRRGGALLEGARVQPNAEAGSYVLHQQDRRVTLREPGSGRVLASTVLGGVLEAVGMSIQVPPSLDLDRPVSIDILYYEDAVSELRAGLSISTTRNTNLIRIGYTAGDPEQAAEVVNAVAAAYRAQAARTTREAAIHRREFLGGQVADMADSVLQSQEELARYQETSSILDPTAAGQTLATLLRDEELELRRLRYQVGVLTSLGATKAGSDPGGQGLARIVALSEDLVPGGRTLQQELRELETERSRLTASRYGYREGSSRVAVIDSLIAGTRRELRVVSRESLGLLRSRVEDVERSVGALRAEAGTLPSRAAAISRLEQRDDGLQMLFQRLTERYHEAQIAEAVAAADVEVVDKAMPPARPDPKSSVRPLLLALLLGLMAGVFGSIALELLSTTVHRSGDAESATQLEILGILPTLKGRTDNMRPAPIVVGGADEQALGPEADAFHELRTTLHYAWDETPKVIAVTSQGPREGKSFTATNLALSMAHQGARVLIVDGDLRRPRQHQIFDVARSYGLSDLLTRRADVGEVLRPVAGKRLWVIPAGGDAPDPVRLLGSQRFERLLERARGGFDFVVVDTPPILAASELCSIAPLTDGVLIVARANQTDRNALAHAVDRLRKVRAPILGLVLNGAPVGRGYRSYGGYYYRYYAYQEYLKSA